MIDGIDIKRCTELFYLTLQKKQLLICPEIINEYYKFKAREKVIHRDF